MKISKIIRKIIEGRGNNLQPLLSSMISSFIFVVLFSPNVIPGSSMILYKRYDNTIATRRVDKKTITSTIELGNNEVNLCTKNLVIISKTKK